MPWNISNWPVITTLTAWFAAIKNNTHTCTYNQYIALRIMISICGNGGSTCSDLQNARLCERTHIEKNHYTIHVNVTIAYANVTLNSFFNILNQILQRTNNIFIHTIFFLIGKLRSSFEIHHICCGNIQIDNISWKNHKNQTNTSISPPPCSRFNYCIKILLYMKWEKSTHNNEFRLR